MSEVRDHEQTGDALQVERAQLLAIFNSIDQAIYVADPETYRILFVNTYLREHLGYDPTGALCYEAFQGRTAPCAFCTNAIILAQKGKPHVWEFHNTFLNRHYLITDRTIRWPDGRDVRFELAIDITERKQAEETLRQSEDRYRVLVNTMKDVLYAVSPQGKLIFVGPQVQRYGYTEDELLGRDFSEIILEADRPLALRDFERTLTSGVETATLFRIMGKDGRIHWFEDIGRLVRDNAGATIAVSGILRDITERKRAEEEQARLQEQLAQAQKMESVGRLAGGIAHDYNNMLSVILGNAELGLMQMDPRHPLHDILSQIQAAAQRSADLTRQLLTFARRQTIRPQMLDVNATLSDALRMLRPLIGEDVDLSWRPGANLWPVKMDPSQVMQLLTNLCVNARDAIRGVGAIVIETANVVFDDAFCADHQGFSPGDFVMISVSDNGCGMDKETLSHLFEPFFTTKRAGQGTGLGLATVYGVVKQNAGFITVYSEPGMGATFRVYIPRHDAPAPQSRAEPESTPVRHGRETVLLVEDEPQILKLGRTLLESLGYRVLCADAPAEALRLANDHAGEIHLLLTDVVMPEMNGRDLAERLRARHPGIRQLFMSGYTTDIIVHQGVLEEGVLFIQKPFALNDLAAKVREALDRPPSDAL